MAKLPDVDDRDVPQSQRDVNDAARRILNFGKYQPQVLSSPPTYPGAKGEFVWVMAGSGTLMVCTTANTNTWKSVVSFSL